MQYSGGNKFLKESVLHTSKSIINPQLSINHFSRGNFLVGQWTLVLFYFDYQSLICIKKVTHLWFVSPGSHSRVTIFSLLMWHPQKTQPTWLRCITKCHVIKVVPISKGMPHQHLPLSSSFTILILLHSTTREKIKILDMTVC